MRRPGSKNERSSCTARAEKPEVAEHVQQVDDGVVVEDDGVVAGLDGDGVGAGAGPLGGFAPDGGGVDRRRVDRALLGVAGAVVRAHRDREQLRRRAALGGADALGVGDRDGLRVRGERSVRGHARRVGGGDDGPRPSARSSGLASAVRSDQRVSRGSAAVRARAGPPSPRAPRRWPRSPRLARPGRRDALVVRPARWRRRRPGGRRRSGGSRGPRRSATFWWISLLANRVSADSPRDDERLGLGRAGCLGRAGRPRSASRRAAPGRRRSRLAAHATTPTWTLRNRAPETPWPTWPIWPGSPLPQFGVPQHRASSTRRRRRRTTATTRT